MSPSTVPTLPSPWPARLHHLRRDSEDAAGLARYYGELLGDAVEPLPGGDWLVAGRGRRMVVGKGAKASVPYYALELRDAAQLAAYRRSLEAHGVPCSKSPSPLFGDEAFAIIDPDGRSVVFGMPRASAYAAPGLNARLQHFVCASTQPEAMLAFYRGRIGMVESDRVLEGRDLSAFFLRSDPEHHSFAAFRAPEARADHHCYETTCWNDIRDWADRLGALRIPLWWGPGRHGPGNNLFFMIQDPDGHKVEFSAELEVMPKDMAHRTWPHEQHTLNLWGSAWMRS
ncbi:MAG: VOC family protein [Proteobacteria bacterium]|nr:VOC family protein [Pseudomonadota bacterium]MDA0983430.1 VOC family protein [Pseudomonadota bacterium]